MRQRMRAARQYRQAMLDRGRRRIQPQLAEFDPRVVDDGMRFGRDLDLGLEEFAIDATGGAEVGSLKQRLGSFRRDIEGLGIGEEIFLLDAELELVVGHKDARLPTRGEESPQAQAPILRVKPEFHPQIPWVCNQNSKSATCQSFECPLGVSSFSGFAKSLSI